MKMASNPAAIRCLQCMSVCNCIGCDPTLVLLAKQTPVKEACPGNCMHTYYRPCPIASISIGVCARAERVTWFVCHDAPKYCCEAHNQPHVLRAQHLVIWCLHITHAFYHTLHSKTKTQQSSDRHWSGIKSSQHRAPKSIMEATSCKCLVCRLANRITCTLLVFGTTGILHI